MLVPRCLLVCGLLTMTGLSLAEEPAALEVPMKTVLPSPVVPDGLGVNIHFTDAKAGEAEMMADAGFGIIRMDFAWGGIERQKGKYDFSAYDRLMKTLDAHKIRALFILDYGNKLYENGDAPRTDEGRKAFARWVAASVEHFKGRGILWEMWNEPNLGHFWKPKPNAEDYAKLSIAAGKALRDTAPGELYFGAATSTIDLRFLEESFKNGALEQWDAVSVHPYRQQPPETAAQEYRALRALIRRHAPVGRPFPILSGEWGYSAAWNGYTEERQGKYLPRQWLTNLANDVHTSIWYDWHDDGQDAKEPEHHFGTVAFTYHKDRTPCYDPKPAFNAAKTLITALKGFRFNKRLRVGDEQNHVMLFSRGEETRLVAWTLAKEPREVALPTGAGRFKATSYLGAESTLQAAPEGLKITLSDTPQYLVPEQAGDLLRLVAAWERVPLEFWHAAGAAPARVTLRLTNPLAKAITLRPTPGAPGGTLAAGQTATWTQEVTVTRAVESVPVRFELDAEGLGRLAQDSLVVVTNPLRVAALPPDGKQVQVRVENPCGEAFAAVVKLTNLKNLTCAQPQTKLVFEKGQQEQNATFQASVDAPEYQYGVRIEDEKGTELLTLPPVRFRQLGGFPKAGEQAHQFRLHPDGDARVQADLKLEAATPAEGVAVAGQGTLKVAYRLGAGWRFLRVAPEDAALKAPWDGQPKALALWVRGDGAGLSPRMRFVDSTGQTFQPTAEPLGFKGWRCLLFRLDGKDAGHWGGKNDGVVHPPVHLDTLFLLDNHAQQPVSGEVYVQAPVLMW